MKVYKVGIIFVLLFITMSGCASRRRYPPLFIDSAVRIAIDKILNCATLKTNPNLYVKNTLFVIDQIVDADTGDITVTSKRITDLVIAESKKNILNITIQPMDTKNIDLADFIIVGVIAQEYNILSKRKTPHLFLSLIDAKSRKIISSTDVWIKNIGISYDPIPIYRDSPIYLKDNRVDALVATAKSQAGVLANKDYLDSLQTSALLDEAGEFYAQGEYDLSLGLFARAAERADGKVMKTFSGLYQNFFKLGKIDKASDAFYELLQLGLMGNNLSIKFLFSVDSTEFAGGSDDIIEYYIWLYEISEALVNSGRCVDIIGHASHSGTVEYNKNLSLKRAQAVQIKLNLETSVMKKITKSYGYGFSENIIGTGTNDARDAIDRRVSFKVVDCDSL